MRTAVNAWLRQGVLAICAALPLATLAASAPDAIVGTWLTDDGASKVAIAATPAAGGTVYNGKVVWLQEPARDGKPLRDANNADASLRDRPILGLEIASGFKPAAGGGWTGGTLYSPRAGKAYPAELALTADGRLELKVKAGIVSRTLYWTR